MDDAKMDGSFGEWIGGEHTELEELLFHRGHYAQAGFYAGFRAAERLAKIEVLKSFWNRAVEEHLDCSDVKDLLDRMLESLKAGN